MPETTQTHARPSTIEHIFGRILTAFVWIGVIRGPFYILEVIGRKSGKSISLPVDLLDFEGRRYLVCARGNSNWVRNARAAGQVVLARAMRRRRYAVRELPPPMRPPILKAYLDRFANQVQRFFPVQKGSPVDSFNPLAVRYPVFELQPLDETPHDAGSR
jgi:deazaflavin-dependent oxidoreductase (nitroreductase family)